MGYFDPPDKTQSTTAPFRPAAPPVPQEAAPRCPTTGQVKPCNSYICQFCYPQPKKHKATCNSGLAKYPSGIPEGVNADRNCDCGATAALDSAMRVARIAWEKLIRIYCKAEYRPLLDDAHVEEIAALIREPLEQSQKFAAQLESNIKFLNERVAAGSERERALQTAQRYIKSLQRLLDEDFTPQELSNEVLEAQKEWAEASRLLGGESK